MIYGMKAGDLNGDFYLLTCIGRKILVSVKLYKLYMVVLAGLARENDLKKNKDA